MTTTTTTCRSTGCDQPATAEALYAGGYEPVCPRHGTGRVVRPRTDQQLHAKARALGGQYMATDRAGHRHVLFAGRFSLTNHVGVVRSSCERCQRSTVDMLLDGSGDWPAPASYTCKGCGGALQARADYCTTCYGQLYETASCHSCGHPTAGTWLCASCGWDQARCARCGSEFDCDEPCVEVTNGVACEAPLPSYSVHVECMADGEVLA